MDGLEKKITLRRKKKPAKSIVEGQAVGIGSKRFRKGEVQIPLSLTYPPSPTLPHLPSLTYPPSPTLPHLPSLTYPPSPTLPHLPSLLPLIKLLNMLLAKPVTRCEEDDMSN